jgi:conjugal transfer ATP-binding protein TraC
MMALDFKALVAEAKQPQHHLHHALPYRDFNEETQIFHNLGSIGFGLRLLPLAGANEEVIDSVHSLLLNLEEGAAWDYQVVLCGHNQVTPWLDANAQAMSQRGGIMTKFAEHETLYAKYAAQQGFQGQNPLHYFDLKNYELFFFVSTTASPSKLLGVKQILEAGLAQLGLAPQALAAADLIGFVNEHLNFSHQRTQPIAPPYNPFEPLHQQMLAPDSTFTVADEEVAVRFTPWDGRDPEATQVVSLGLKRLPSEMRMYQLPEMLASVLQPEKSLVCPHRISINFRILNSGRESLQNSKKVRTLDKLLQSPMRLFIPQAEAELTERRALEQGLAEQGLKVSTMLLTVTLYTPAARQLHAITKAKASLERAQLELVPLRQLQCHALLAALPFQMSEGYHTDCHRLGRLRRLKTTNLVNFLPLVAEFKQLHGGMLLPTMRHQLSFFDPFQAGGDNYNIALTGGSGSGKSFFMQSLAKSVYGRGGRVWILDKGASYKKLTQILGGAYLDHQQIRLNPFTHLHHIGEAGAEDGLQLVLQDVVGLFAAMAAPNTDLTDFEQSMLGEAILLAYRRHQHQTVVDHVQMALQQLATQHGMDQRLQDLVVQLNKYNTQGVYGKIFNEPSQLDPNVEFTTLELDGFGEDLLRPVVFALLVTINQQMYLVGRRTIPKMCIIEEAWSLMRGGNRQARAFIDKGYRTARKFGGSYVSVTQGIEDFFGSDEARAAFNNSDIHITFRQGQAFNQFLKEHPQHFNAYETMVIKSFKVASTAGHSCCMIKVGGRMSLHRVFADAWTRALLSTEPHEYAYCEQLLRQGVDVLSAVEQTAQHFYPADMAAFAEIKAAYAAQPVQVNPDALA